MAAVSLWGAVSNHASHKLALQETLQLIPHFLQLNHNFKASFKAFGVPTLMAEINTTVPLLRAREILECHLYLFLLVGIHTAGSVTGSDRANML